MSENQLEFALDDPLFAAVGNTRLIKLNHLFPNDKGIEVFAKLEYENPSGSIKDRIVVHILRHAIKNGQLKPGGTVVEATSGNTGASLAMFCKQLGLRLILTTPAKTSEEKQNHMREWGAELIICPGAPHGSPDHYQARAEQIAAETQGAFHVNQYENPLNVDAHYETTGPEIWRQMDGRVDFLVAGGSTGGTIMGTGKYLKEQNPRLGVLLPDPVGSVLYRYATTGVEDPKDVRPFRVEGMGKDHVTRLFDRKLIDEAMQYNDAAAFDMCHRMKKAEDIFPGLSAGGNLCGAAWLIPRVAANSRIVVIIPDSGKNYLSKFAADAAPRPSLFSVN